MLLRLLLFLSGAGTLFAAPLNNWSQTQEKSGTLEIFSRWDAGGNGNKALDNLIQFDINNFSSRKDWKSRYSVSLGEHHFRTECVSSNGSSFHYEMKIIPVSARELRLDAAVKTGKPYPRSGLTLTLSKANLGEYVRLTGISPAGKAFVKEVRYEPENVTRFWHYDGRKELCSKIEIPLNQGMLILSGFEASVIVSKYWSGVANLTILFPDEAQTISLRLQYSPWKMDPLPLERHANRTFADEFPGDGKGGWTDQGPEQDLSMFSPRSRKFANVQFTFPDNGNQILALADRKGFSPEISLPVDGTEWKHLYFLHAGAWCKTGSRTGELEVVYSDGSRSKYDVVSQKDLTNWVKIEPGKLPNASCVWSYSSNGRKAALYLSRFSLSGKPVKEILLRKGEGKSVWLIAGITGVRDLWIPFRRTGLTETPYRPVPGKEWMRFPLHENTIVRGSALDLSDVGRHIPAGKYGPIVIRNGRFVFRDRPNEPVRLNGANLTTDGCFLRDDDREPMLDLLAAYGYNAVRFHHFDELLVKNSDPLELDPLKLDALFRTMALCKQKGFYITLDLYTRRLSGFPKSKDLRRPGEVKILNFFDCSIRDNIKEFARQLLTTRNPYTGLALKDDPALTHIGLINEDPLFEHWISFPNTSPKLQKPFQEFYDDFCRKHHLDPKDIRLNWIKCRLAAHRELIADLRNFLRTELGCNRPVADISSGVHYVQNIPRNDNDYTDLHGYWDHPMEIDGCTVFEDNNAIGGGGFERTFRNRILGKPFVVTEWHFCYPNSFRSIGGAYFGALAAFQGADAVYDFAPLAFAYRFSGGKNPFIGKGRNPTADSSPFALFTDPLTMMSVRMAAFLYLRGDVSESRAEPFVYTIDPNVTGREYEMLVYKDIDKNLRPLQLAMFQRKIAVRIGKPHTGEVSVEDVWRAHCQGKSRDFLHRFGLQSDILQSDTKELSVIPQREFMRIVTPRSEALMTPPAGDAKGNLLSIRGNQTYTTVFATALDSLPLRESRRILFLHLTDIKPGEGNFSRFGTKLKKYKWSMAKFRLIRKDRTRISLKNNGNGTPRLYALDLSGARLREIPFTDADGLIAFTADNTIHEKCPMAYELVRE